MDRLRESRQQWLLGIGSERWTATEREKESIVLFCFVCVFSSLLLDRLID